MPTEEQIQTRQWAEQALRKGRAREALALYRKLLGHDKTEGGHYEAVQVPCAPAYSVGYAGGCCEGGRHRFGGRRHHGCGGCEMDYGCGTGGCSPYGGYGYGAGGMPEGAAPSPMPNNNGSPSDVPPPPKRRDRRSGPFRWAKSRAILVGPPREPAFGPGRTLRRSSLPGEVRRSLKTQQHAHRQAASSACLVSRFDPPRFSRRT